MHLDKDLFNIDGLEISSHEKSKRIIEIKIKDEIIKKLIFPFHKFDITDLISSTIEKYEGTNFIYDKIEKIFFVGKKNLIKRCLNNLIDNSLKTFNDRRMILKKQ